jgi:hypothetical protein
MFIEQKPLPQKKPKQLFTDLRSLLSKIGFKVINGAIHSYNYVANSAGWKLTNDGDFEANSGTFRGNLVANSIDIPDTTTANSFHVNNTGDAWWGAAAIGSAVAKVLKTGVAYFTGCVIDGTSTIDGKTATGFSVVVDDGVAPASPTGLTASAGIQSVFLKWTWNTETDMDHYDIYRYTADTQASAVKIASVKVNMLFDSGLTAATPYYYWIKAIDRKGNASGFNASAGTTATPRNVGESDVSDGAITVNKINVAQLSAIAADLGAITAGTIVLPSGGLVRSGQTAYDTGTGWWIGNDGGTPKLSIGNSAGNKLIWDGSALSIVGLLLNVTGVAASNTLVASADTQEAIGGTSYSQEKEIIVRLGGTIRIKFDLRGDPNNVGEQGRGKIYVNDVAVGTERANSEVVDFITYSEDITVAPYDNVQLWGRTQSGNPYSQIKNFRIYYDITSLEQTTVTED